MVDQMICLVFAQSTEEMEINMIHRKMAGVTKKQQ